MSNEDSNYQDIPEIFYSFENKQPFTHCIECKKLLDDQTEYVIEKAIRNYKDYQATDTIFDYAMCMDCAIRMRSFLSKDSREKMDAFFSPHFQKLAQVSQSPENLDVEACLSKCLITDNKREATGEFQVYAFCKGNQLSKKVPPYMISEEAVEQLLPLLSAETTDFLDGFFDKHFSPDPSILEPIRPKLVLI